MIGCSTNTVGEMCSHNILLRHLHRAPSDPLFFYDICTEHHLIHYSFTYPWHHNSKILPHTLQSNISKLREGLTFRIGWALCCVAGNLTEPARVSSKQFHLPRQSVALLARCTRGRCWTGIWAWLRCTHERENSVVQITNPNHTRGNIYYCHLITSHSHSLPVRW